MKKIISLIGVAAISCSSLLPIINNQESQEQNVEILELNYSVDTSRYADENKGQALPGIYDETESFKQFITDSREKLGKTNYEDFTVKSSISNFEEPSNSSKRRDALLLEKVLKSEKYEIIGTNAVVTEHNETESFFDFYTIVEIDNNPTYIDLNGYDKNQKFNSNELSGGYKNTFIVEVTPKNSQTFKFQKGQVITNGQETEFVGLVEYINEIKTYIKLNKIEESQLHVESWYVAAPISRFENDKWTKAEDPTWIFFGNDTYISAKIVFNLSTPENPKIALVLESRSGMYTLLVATPNKMQEKGVGNYLTNFLVVID
ncbi:hypothetical protein SSABA_v1c09190 [Spiroplasma sabaudiense Ar-1343]|uniref:Lipoprotein n=1 Tax=Spiroplasma sabaudiense Ar-1343 TaxID=1276257 RepID=W6AAX1_9MOLU|nr:hypothetical protein [Spiroplasma sabaudiense]AHI54318.1 hypothetical protein SSABA_v1c09190 [Spiroplasma sabaudiense Ar-1343]